MQLSKLAARRHVSIGKYVCFEPGKRALTRLKQCRLDGLVPINAGVSDHSGEMSFSSEGVGGKLLSMEAGSVNSIHVMAIDDCEECVDATFIKMDVEGAEGAALDGAKRTIAQNRPKLAICIYHSDADMIEIPEKLMGMCINYRFYVRQHSFYPPETVFYAIPIHE